MIFIEKNCSFRSWSPTVFISLSGWQQCSPLPQLLQFLILPQILVLGPWQDTVSLCTGWERTAAFHLSPAVRSSPSPLFLLCPATVTQELSSWGSVGIARTEWLCLHMSRVGCDLGLLESQSTWENIHELDLLPHLREKFSQLRLRSLWWLQLVSSWHKTNQ